MLMLIYALHVSFMYVPFLLFMLLNKDATAAQLVSCLVPPPSLLPAHAVTQHILSSVNTTPYLHGRLQREVLEDVAAVHEMPQEALQWIDQMMTLR